jgi:CO dehydrogenase/acetyl-CoA synthase delta subunit
MNYLLSRLLVFPVEAEVGDNITVSIVITNPGVQPGTYTVALKSAGEVIQTLDVTIDGGSSMNVELDSTAKFGEFKVVAGELTAGFRVFF